MRASVFATLAMIICLCSQVVTAEPGDVLTYNAPDYDFGIALTFQDKGRVNANITIDEKSIRLSGTAHGDHLVIINGNNNEREFLIFYTKDYALLEPLKEDAEFGGRALASGVKDESTLYNLLPAIYGNRNGGRLSLIPNPDSGIHTALKTPDCSLESRFTMPGWSFNVMKIDRGGTGGVVIFHEKNYAVVVPWGASCPSLENYYFPVLAEETAKMKKDHASRNYADCPNGIYTGDMGTVKLICDPDEQTGEVVIETDDLRLRANAEFFTDHLATVAGFWNDLAYVVFYTEDYAIVKDARSPCCFIGQGCVDLYTPLYKPGKEIPAGILKANGTFFREEGNPSETLSLEYMYEAKVKVEIKTSDFNYTGEAFTFVNHGLVVNTDRGQPWFFIFYDKDVAVLVPARAFNQCDYLDMGMGIELFRKRAASEEE